MTGEYIPGEDITGARRTETPYKGQTVTGYGGAIPTTYMVQYRNRWYRVKVMVYGNSGSAYITSKGVDLFLSSDAEYKIQDLTGENSND